MNSYLIIITSLLMILSLFGTKARLTALTLSLFLVFPVIKPLGLRSAIYAPDLVIATALIPWIIQKQSRDILNTSSWLKNNLLIIFIWTIITTILGYWRLYFFKEISYRVPLAGLRMGAILLSFAIPASMALSKKEFITIVKILGFSFYIFLVIAILDYNNLLSFRFFFPVKEIQSQHEEAIYILGGLDRASIGSLAIIGLFLSILLTKMRISFRILNITSIIGFIVLILLSRSRTSFIALITFGLCLIIMQKNDRIKNIFYLFAGLITIYVIITKIPMVTERLNTLTSLESAEASSGRVEGWQKAVNYLWSEPLVILTGVGFDCWQYSLYQNCGLANGHNLYLHIWAELGLVGGIIYIAFFIRLAIRFFIFMQQKGEASKIGGLTFCLMLSLFVWNMTEVGLYPSITRINALHAIMFLLGLMISYLRYLGFENLLAMEK